MFNHFIKYHSLGNDFIIFDCYKKPLFYVDAALQRDTWSQFVRDLCNRHTGVGADGVLIIKSAQGLGSPEMVIFNADGSSAAMCMNGLRCVAHYLVGNYGFADEFVVHVGDHLARCSAERYADSLLITTKISHYTYQGIKHIKTDKGSFDGHQVWVGNPHVVIFEQTQLDWLAAHGHLLERHALFPQRTNVEFVWLSQNNEQTCNHQASYSMLVYERGCGITQACSSGAAATLVALVQTGALAVGDQVALCMPGGMVQGKIDEHSDIVLVAPAHLVFKGELPKDE